MKKTIFHFTNHLICIAFFISSSFTLFSQKQTEVNKFNTSTKVKSLSSISTSYLSQFWKPKTFITPATSNAGAFITGVTPNVTVSVLLTDTINKVLSTQFGVNSNFRSGSGILTRVPLYTDANFGQYRFPAGSGSNVYFWDGIIPTDTTNMNQTMPLPILGTNANYFTPTLFAQFLSSTGAQANVVVNYFYARYGKTAVNSQVGATAAQIRTARVKQAADYAAGFVKKMNIDLKAKILNWEIGNECYGKWEQGYNVKGLGDVTGTEYGEDFKVFASAMKAIDPTIKVGAVLDQANVIWSSQVLTQVKNVADFLIIHEYFTPEKTATPATILASVSNIKNAKDTINKWVVKYTGNVSDYYPIALTEFNSRGTSSVTMVNGLFFSSVLGELIKNGYGFSTSWVNEWGLASKTTMGLISQADDVDQPVYTPRQAYMPYYFYGKYFGDYMVNSSATGSGVNVYSSVFSRGEAGIVIVNNNGTDQTVKINMNTTKYNNKKAYWHEFYATDTIVGNKKFFINGQTGTTQGGGPTNYTSIPLYSAIFKNNSILTVKKFSVTFINLSLGLLTDNTPQTENPAETQQFDIWPNPATSVINISLNQNSKLPTLCEIRDVNGKSVYKYTINKNSFSIPTSSIGTKGIYFIAINSVIKKIVIN